MIKLHKATFEFSQEGDTNGNTEEFEELNVTIDSPLFIDEENGCYIILKTNTGWSVDSTEELTKLLDECVTASKKIGIEKE